MSAISVPTNSSPGTCLPSTTRHTVSGVAMSRPSGPQSHVQNATDASSATCETPAAPAYSTVSSTRFVNSSSTTNNADHPERTGPALERRKADQDRRAGAEHGPDVRDESQRRAERRPDQRVRHAEEVEPDAGGDAVDEIDQRLHQQLPADAGSRLVERLRRDRQLAVPEQPDQPIAQIPAFEQHEDDHRHHEPGRAQLADDRTEPREARETRDLLGGDHDGPRDRSFGRLRFSEVGLDVFDRLLQLLDRSPLARAAHVRDLRQDVGAVARKVLGQMVHLPRQTPAGETEDREHQRDHRENGRDAADPTLSQVTGGVSTNVSRMASAIGTSTACAQYRTTTTSTHPANVTHGLTVLDASSIKSNGSW